MKTPQIRINTEGFRAIGKAEIIINGITVVAGENGCGKSTISKLLYYLYKTASNYDILVLNNLDYKLKDVKKFLEIIQHELYASSKDRGTREEFGRELKELNRFSETSLEDQLENWLTLINKASFLYAGRKGLFGTDPLTKRFSFSRGNRIMYIMKDILKLDEMDLDEKAPLPFDKISEFVKSVFKEAFGKIKSRPTSLFLSELRDVFTEGELPKVFEVMEFDDQIISINKSSISIPYSVQRAIYIDTPMSVGIDMSDNQYWDDLNELLLKSGKSNFTELSRTISNEIIHGDVSVDSETALFSSDLYYKREDGAIYNLLDCATGIKSFAILQLLIKNGSLTDKTLLIIDEPESNLHPQWIIEYARLIVLLNKIIGVKFFVATHNPDMVSAIKYISEKENIADNLNFYLAEKRPQKFIYDYRHLGADIDRIFASFNIALERIHQYGA